MRPKKNEIGWSFCVKFLRNPHNAIHLLKEIDVYDISEY